MSFSCSSAASLGMLTGRPPTVTVDEPAQPAIRAEKQSAAISRFMAYDPADRYCNSWVPRLSQAVSWTGAMMGIGTTTAGM